VQLIVNIVFYNVCTILQQFSNDDFCVLLTMKVDLTEGHSLPPNNVFMKDINHVHANGPHEQNSKLVRCSPFVSSSYKTNTFSELYSFNT